MTEKPHPQLNPWGNELIGEEDYQYLINEFGIEDTNDLEIPASFIESNRFFRRKLIFGHREFGMIIKAYLAGKKWAVISGIKPSGPYHLGTLTTAAEMVELQKQGGFVYYSIADIESWADHHQPYDKSLEIAVDNVADILALGLDPNRAYIWLQSKEQMVKEMVFDAGAHVTMNMMKAIYGEDKSFGLYNAALVQVGDIYLPQLKDEIQPTVVPVGIDQDPHIRLSRDLAKYFTKNGQTIMKPCSTYHKLMPALDDITKKMSKSRPNSYFKFSDPPQEIKKKIMGAYTGGRGSAEEQRRLGGEPERCMIFKILNFHFEPDDKALNDLYTECRSGQLLCGQCKKRCADKVLAVIKEHNEKKVETVKLAEKILKGKF